MVEPKERVADLMKGALRYIVSIGGMKRPDYRGYIETAGGVARDIGIRQRRVRRAISEVPEEIQGEVLWRFNQRLKEIKSEFVYKQGEIVKVVREKVEDDFYLIYQQQIESIAKLIGYDIVFDGAIDVMLDKLKDKVYTDEYRAIYELKRALTQLINISIAIWGKVFYPAFRYKRKEGVDAFLVELAGKVKAVKMIQEINGVIHEIINLNSQIGSRVVDTFINPLPELKRAFYYYLDKEGEFRSDEDKEEFNRVLMRLASDFGVVITADVLGLAWYILVGIGALGMIVLGLAGAKVYEMIFPPVNMMTIALQEMDKLREKVKAELDQMARDIKKAVIAELDVLEKSIIEIVVEIEERVKKGEPIEVVVVDVKKKIKELFSGTRGKVDSYVDSKAKEHGGNLDGIFDEWRKRMEVLARRESIFERALTILGIGIAGYLAIQLIKK